ncbi:MAG: hypothetical protein ACTSV9_02875, partial [Candidatus Thorarchaeota archaeon]
MRRNVLALAFFVILFGLSLVTPHSDFESHSRQSMGQNAFTMSGIGDNTEDYVDQTSNLHAPTDLGTHSVFADLQDYGSNYDQMQEENTGGGSTSGVGTEVGISTTIYDGDDEYGAGPSVVFRNDTHGWIFVQENGAFSYSSWAYYATTDGGDTWSGPSFIEDVATQTPRSWSVWADWWTAGNTGTLIHLVSNSYDQDVTKYNWMDAVDESTGSWVDVDTSGGAHNSPDGGGMVCVSTSGEIWAGSFMGTSGQVSKYTTSWADATPSWLHEDDDDHGQFLPLSDGDILYLYEDSSANSLLWAVYDEGLDTGGSQPALTTLTSETTHGVEDENWGPLTDGNNNTYL